MKKFEALTLEDAYKKASEFFKCSIVNLDCEVIQNPKDGIFGLGRKSAIIVADIKDSQKSEIKDSNQSVQKKYTTQYETPKSVQKSELDDAIAKNFFKEPVEGYVDELCSDKVIPTPNKPLANEIEVQLKQLFSKGCFRVDTIEVDVVDNTAFIFLDGEDAALLIGKDGYRYNALSYMIFNWLYIKYELFVKLEVARFLTTQKEMICVHLEPIIEIVKRDGKGKTKPFDGILAQIALERLREVFPDKYVAIKSNKSGEKYILINEFMRK